MARREKRPEQFYGAWALVDWRIEYDDGSVTRPFGANAIGQILYTEDGEMSATVSRPNRASLRQANARKASYEQKAESFDSYFHYAGTWRIDGDNVIHDVTLSLNQNMVGTQQVRRAVFSGSNNLMLSAKEPLTSGGTRHHILQWKKDA